jgi:hypothetical protein
MVEIAGGKMGVSSKEAIDPLAAPVRDADLAEVAAAFGMNVLMGTILAAHGAALPVHGLEGFDWLGWRFTDHGAPALAAQSPSCVPGAWESRPDPGRAMDAPRRIRTA